MSAERTDAHRRAEARYEATGRKGHAVSVRLTEDETAWLDAQRRGCESRAGALRRLARVPGWRKRGKHE